MERNAGMRLMVLPNEADDASVEVVAQGFGPSCRVIDLGSRVMSGIEQAVHAVVAAFGVTLRERQVLREVVAGLSNRQISKKLGIAVSTVKSHLESIFRRTRTSGRFELCALVYRCMPSA